MEREKLMYRLNEKTVKLVNEILLYALVIEFQLYGTVWAMLNVSGKPYLILYWGFVCLGLFKLCIQGNHWKDWLLILGFGILAVLSWRASGDKTPLLFMLGVCCSRDLKLDRLMTADLAGRIVSALFLILFPLLGICPNQTISMRGIERMFFGWQGPNGMGLSFLMICMEWMYLRHRRFRWFDYAGIMGILVFVHVTANSRTAEVLMAAVLLAEAFAKLWERYGKRWKEYVIWTWGCIFALGMDLILPVFALVLYRWKKPELMALSGSFIARFQLPGMFLEAHGLSWFGSPYDPGIYDYLDMMFAYLVLHLGIVMALIALILMAGTILYGYRKQNERFLLFFMILLLRSMAESEHLNLLYAFLPVLLGLAFWNRGTGKLKDGKEQ